MKAYLRDFKHLWSFQQKQIPCGSLFPFGKTFQNNLLKRLNYRRFFMSFQLPLHYEFRRIQSVRYYQGKCSWALSCRPGGQ